MSPVNFLNVWDLHKLSSYSVEQQGVFLLLHVQKCHRKTSFMSFNVKHNYVYRPLAN